MCEFTENVLGQMMKWHNLMDDVTKLALFKIFHLSIVIHYPGAHIDETHSFSINTESNVPAMNYAHDIQLWHKHLRQMHHIVESEIKESGNNYGRTQTVPKYCDTFISMAAALCGVVC